MNTNVIRSYSKINLSLRIIGKKPSTRFHKIQSIITFANLFDFIKIKEINSNYDEIKISGKFKYGISQRNNTITKTLKVLRSYNYLKKKKFKILIKKNIPHSAGLGGGSMNSAALVKFFLLTYKININKTKLFKLTKEIGSDVPLGLEITNTFLKGAPESLKRFKDRLKLYIVLANPGIQCSTRDAYSKNKYFSKPYPEKISINFNSLFRPKDLILDRNDLELTVFKQYPKIKRLRDFIKVQEKCIFSRMTGSGSTCVGYFHKLKNVKKAKKNIRKKFPNYWCEIAKTI